MGAREPAASLPTLGHRPIWATVPETAARPGKRQAASLPTLGHRPIWTTARRVLQRITTAEGYREGGAWWCKWCVLRQMALVASAGNRERENGRL